MDRGQTFCFQWIEPRYLFHTWSRPEYFGLPKPGPEYLKKITPRPPPPPWESNGRSLIPGDRPSLAKSERAEKWS